jgi:hypothetical protein
MCDLDQLSAGWVLHEWSRLFRSDCTSYPARTNALVHLQQDVLRINHPQAHKAQSKPATGLVIDLFTKAERIEEIVKQPPGEATITDGFSSSTAHGYRNQSPIQSRNPWRFDYVGFCGVGCSDSVR